MNDHDLIERLRAAGTQTPGSRNTPDAVLAAGRRAAARRTTTRIGGATLSLAAVVVAGMALTPANSGTQVVTAAGDGAPADAGSVPGVPGVPAELDPGADPRNAAILQKALGQDFDVRDDAPDGKLLPGTDSAENLPEAYSGTVSLMASVSGPAALKVQCAPLTEKGSTFDACVTRTLPDGSEVQARFFRWAPTVEYPQSTAGEAVRVLFLQPDNTLVWVDLVASTDADDSTSTSSASARTWLSSMVDRLGSAAAHPDVDPVAFDGDAAEQDDSTKQDEAPAAEKAAVAKKMTAAAAAQDGSPTGK